ncbi:transmembrane and coiled-coil domains protein 2 isoform X4 [Onthophagus taurus]|uniref:transmembrane and coiled-coil domains protein 2 isoform X4 n=1 Tax=Onthophagus taurus TaxID=166361 RepID=UPI000C1FEC2A|nr:transmembrane and coiled-coil domains protein 2 isoform X3 [Onthophagus taurus]
MQILNLFVLGAMDSLHVSGQQSGSKTSSRSTSPCRPRSSEYQVRGHHMKSLSHGSADSTKSQQDVMTQQQQQQASSSATRTSRHRSPAAPKSSDMDDSTTLSHALDDSCPLTEGDTSDICYPPSFVSNGSSEHAPRPEDDSVTDSAGNSTRINPVIEQLEHKIIRTKDLIRTEQKLRDDNVNEYLKLSTNADKQQLQRIKAVFEKKNQKSAQVISQLQKKLDNYQKRVQVFETQGVQGHKPTREVLRDMGQGLKNVGGNIRDGISGLSGTVMSKPREFAHLIKNKFGSADNISQLSNTHVEDNIGTQHSSTPPGLKRMVLNKGVSAWYIGPGTTGSDGSGTNGGAGGSDQGEKNHHGSATLPANLHVATSHNSMSQNAPPKFSDDGSECSSVVTSESIDRYGRAQEDPNQEYNLKVILKELQARSQEMDRLKEKVERTKHLEQEVQILSKELQEEKFRTERLEEQINDLTELHQNEVENLKQLMNELEERIQYQSEERLRDIHEMLEHCQTKIQKMEHQALQQQQYVTLEGIDNSNARALVVKLINVLLTVLQVVLLLVATCAGIIMPFLRTSRSSRRTVTVFETIEGARPKLSLTASCTSFITRTFSKT